MQTYYLDHPEAFAKFYVIARLYAVAWAIIGALGGLLDRPTT